MNDATCCFDQSADLLNNYRFQNRGVRPTSIHATHANQQTRQTYAMEPNSAPSGTIPGGRPTGSSESL